MEAAADEGGVMILDPAPEAEVIDDILTDQTWVYLEREDKDIVRFKAKASISLYI